MTTPVDIPDLPELIQQGPLALCSLTDIAGTLGFQDSSSLTSQQIARIPYLLAKLCSLFRTEAGRQFSPGTTTVQLLTLSGRIILPDPLGDSGTVDQIVNMKGDVIDPQNYSIRNNSVWIEEPSLIGKDRPGTGTPYEVTYTHTGEVPWDVRAAMASSVARYLTIDPNSAVAQSTFLSSEGYHQRIAAWVADVVKLFPEDIDLARAHRPYPVNVIVQKMPSQYGGNGIDWSRAWAWGGIQLW